MGQSNWLIAPNLPKTRKKKKKVGLVRHPQLINMKQNNKYPPNKHPFFFFFLKAPSRKCFQKEGKKKTSECFTRNNILNIILGWSLQHMFVE
jgi:hypothetical protein